MSPRLYERLPGLFRQRDATPPEPGAPAYRLRALLDAIEQEIDLLEADILASYEDWFVETSTPAALARIGALLGVELHPRSAELPFTQRALVADAIALRRRKGTAAVLERVIQDRTGWACRVVELVDNLVLTPHVRHVRPSACGLASVRDLGQMDRLDGPFDTAAHLPDLRRAGVSLESDELLSVASERRPARPAPGRVAIFLWRQEVHTVTNTCLPVMLRPPRHPTHGVLRVDPLGRNIPLHHQPVTLRQIDLRMGQEHAPQPLSNGTLTLAARGALSDSPSDAGGGLSDGTGRATVEEGNLQTWWGREASVVLEWKDGETWTPVPAEELTFGSVSGAGPDEWRLDVSTGLVHAARIPVRARYSHASPGAIGGGPYERTTAMFAPPRGAWTAVVGGPDATHQDIRAAIDAWSRQRSEQPTMVSDTCHVLLMRSEQHPDTLTVEIPEGTTLVIQAANGHRPVLGGMNLSSSAAGTTVVLDGLWIRGVVTLTGTIEVDIRHCTVHSWPIRRRAILARGTTTLKLHRSVVSGVACTGATAAQWGSRIHASESLIYGMWPLSGDSVNVQEDAVTQSSPEGDLEVKLERCTVLGGTSCRTLTAMDTLLEGAVIVSNIFSGQLRFCYVRRGEKTPARYRCQPDLAVREVGTSAREATEARMVPTFLSLQPGQPGFGQLHMRTPLELRRGASDQGALGAFHFLMNPVREDELRTALDEFLPAGIEPDIILMS